MSFNNNNNIINNSNNNNNNNNNNKKESITDRFNKIKEEEDKKENVINQDAKDIKEILKLNGENYSLEQLEKRRLYLEREIVEINKALTTKKIPPPIEKDPWYKKYPLINSVVTHPDFKVLADQISIMSFAGLIVGGAHGFSVGNKYLRDSIAKNAHSPLSMSSIQLNSKKTLGLLVVRNAFVFSYRCGIYTTVFCGVETLLRHNAGDSVLNSIAGGTAAGFLAGFHLRKRGNLAIPILMGLGSSMGCLMGCADMLNKKIVSSLKKFTGRSD
ncbi:hypothetical protein DICPUDRAFT_151646 [Dictyostelium purpureum]|uniref:Mitochondrial import inner membrane translocase subunit TIM22 n=1 Tax=Dictyostelium purpureum TaxID=5786 RepID=F0ZJD8_DICPU|nr:uncharacterized protein DICPUDRAFT_151646 [Dictyostelium purpureum]EGC35964.1 hypothetical protein DICPUDRAFT_151646 [Dictyostelium purpureum]|eukprot:XP_003287537.1 hypothetical protein DICPUDRAFT_151646 [Dictyostelium purpureum]